MVTPHQREPDGSITALPPQQHTVMLANVGADSMARHKCAQSLGPSAYLGCGLCSFQVQPHNL